MPTARNSTSAKSNANPQKAAAAKIEAAAAPKTTRRAATPKAGPEITSKPAQQSDITSARQVAPEQRRQYVEVAAYYIAERRGFVSGDESGDWFAAEAEIDRLLGEYKRIT